MNKQSYNKVKKSDNKKQTSNAERNMARQMINKMYYKAYLASADRLFLELFLTVS